MSIERAILNFLDELKPVHMHGFLLSLRGETLAEGYWKPFEAVQPHRLYSVSKSVTSLAIGMLAEEGVLSLDDCIVTHFPEWVDERTSPLLREVTIRDMLRMATCYDRSMYSPATDSDWTKPFFYGKPTHPCGTLFNYDTSASQVMCALVEKKTGRDMLSFMEERLFRPIGMTGPKKWLKDDAGASQGGTGLLLTLRDFAKLAEFCMSDGRGLVSAEYLRAATSWQIATDERSAPEERYGYGYQFWRMREGFAMYGMGGQMGLCLPDRQIALVTTADTMMDSTGVQPIYDAFFRHLSRIDGLSHDPHDAAELADRLDALCLEPVTAESQREPLHFDLSHSALPFTALSIDSSSVTFVIDNKDYVLPYQSGGWVRGTFPASQEPCIISGGWVSPSRFILRTELVGDHLCGMDLFLVQRPDGSASIRTNSTMRECIPNWAAQGYTLHAKRR